MKAWIFRTPPCRCCLQAAAVFLTTAAATLTTQAQTLTDPGPDPASKTRTPAAPSQQTKVKSCPAYGPGFVQLPGSDLCVKVGGSVQGEVGRR